MLSRSELAVTFTLNPPASPAAIEREEAEYGRRLPGDFVELVRVSDGMCTDGSLSILGVEGVVQRNADYEVQTCLPGFFMIGDDGGGSAILLNLQDRRIYEVDMGAMDEESMELCAESLDELLLLGTSLGEREG
ncbi:SMI1/KNR4 family protein [Zhihengliuella salsuginis]|uniref:Knr4/Smi1-like domain-containing protein n=1 Tax=Zhihengliuella salsuginis TaxID=578222 RepID=A0ABQ3GGP4_9MICC|nr:SMI1/KNR4 family protein [Zhihengliuella salsuginis]GHD03989.1 hypothetical protein GCM10008096_10750 [Zhihengliuella salsuginis]